MTTRSRLQLFLFALLFGFVLVLAIVNHGMAYLVHPIDLWIEGAAADTRLLAWTVGPDGALEPAKKEHRTEPGVLANFRTERFPYRKLILLGPPDTLDGITHVKMRLSLRTIVMDQELFRKEWLPWDGPLPPEIPAGWQGRVYQTPLSPQASRIAILDQAINYEGDPALARYVLVNPLFLLYTLFFVVLFLAYPYIAHGCPTSAMADSTETNAPTRSWPWFAAGIAVLLAAGFVLEWQHPYYFTQDDNLAQFLPHILCGCESLFAGEFPSWNPQQYLGAPLAEIGTYALTYPGTYLSYAAATFVLGDKNATIDVFCGLHLLLGYVAIFWLGRCLGLAAPLASAFSLCQVLSGFALIGGRSWYYMTPVYLWVPLLFVALLHVRDRVPSLRWTLATGLVIGLFFHAGNAQMWIYGVGLAALFAVLCCLNQTMPWMRLVQMLPAGLIGTGIAAVLLVPQFLATRELERSGGGGWDASEGALAMLVPYPMPIATYVPDGRKYADLEHFGTTYYAGSVFTLAWLSTFAIAVIWRGTLRWYLSDPWRVLALLTFLLALGHVAKLWTWQAHLPVFNQFNHALKLLPFFHLFSGAAGAMLLDRMFDQSARPSRWRMATFVLVAMLLLYHAFWARSALFVYAEQPYPALPAELSALQRDPVRIVPITLMRSPAGNYIVGLQHHFPTAFGIASFGGYDPIIEQDARYRAVLKDLHADPLPTLRKHGVTHVVVHREVMDALAQRDWSPDDWRRLPAWFSAVVTECERNAPIMTTNDVRVFALKDTTPIACAAKNPQHGLPVKLTHAGVDIDVSSLTDDRTITLNYLWRPGTRIYADNTLLPSEPDADQHIRVAVPAGAQRLSIRYESPWPLGLLVGSVLIVAGLVGYGGVYVWRKRR